MVSRPISTATQTGRILLEKQTRVSEQNREDEDMAKYVSEYGAN